MELVRILRFGEYRIYTAFILIAMKRRLPRYLIPTGLATIALGWCVAQNMPPQEVQPWSGWLVNDEDRTAPPRVLPADEPGGAPSDATVLFDGDNLDAWDGGVRGEDGRWVIRDGVMVPEGAANDIRSNESFGDCQLHVEFRVPEGRQLNGQMGANSGVFLMGLYEVQVNLCGEENSTYPDGMPGAIYGQAPPLADASTGLGDWQSYDILFRAPRFDEAGEMVDPGLITVLMNGICVQHGWAFQGPTQFRKLPQWSAHGERAPLKLQFHGDPVEYRNIWIRDVPAYGWDAKSE